jgi:DNA-binding SARP family transcriptional activator
LLDYREEHVTLCPHHPLRVDVEAFEEAASTARKEEEPAAYRAAIDLYAGELLPTDRYQEWVEERRRELRESFLSLLVELAGFCEGRGEYEAAVEALARAVANEPAHDPVTSSPSGSNRVDTGDSTSRVPGVVAYFRGGSRSISEAILTDERS